MSNKIIAFVLDQTQEVIKGLSDEDKAKVLSQLSNELFAQALALFPVKHQYVPASEIIGTGEYYDPLIKVLFDEFEVVGDVGALELVVHTVEAMLHGKRD